LDLRFGQKRDRRRYLRWVFEAKKRFGLLVLDYMVTSNHIHVLIKDTGRSAHEYNQRVWLTNLGRKLLKLLRHKALRPVTHYFPCDFTLTRVI
jgi:hypothetical protein